MDWDPYKHVRNIPDLAASTNPLDLLQPAGFVFLWCNLCKNNFKLPLDAWHVHIICPSYIIPRLLLLVVLRGCDHMVMHFGVPCSSWVVVSRGTTQRSYLSPMGTDKCLSVAEGNCIVARTVIMGCWVVGLLWFRDPIVSIEKIECIIIHWRYTSSWKLPCSQPWFPLRMVLAIWLLLGKLGTFTLEQPSSSIIMRHRRLQELLRVIRAS